MKTTMTVDREARARAEAAAEARAECGTRFAEWAMKNEIAEPPLDWAWFGEIVRWSGSRVHVENEGSK